MRNLIPFLTLLALTAFGCAEADPGSGTTPPAEPVCGNGDLEEGEVCDDSNVISGDGCSAFCELEEVCTDTLDNDGDGDIDCDDRDCSRHTSCVEDCSTAGDEDGDGLSDCEDPDCAEADACTVAVREDCDTPGDEDENGFADCEDEACADSPACLETPEEDCDTVGDEDGNGRADCADPVCVTHPDCQEPLAEDCDTVGDEDGNDLADCNDPVCAGVGDCAPINCGDGTLQEDEGEQCDAGEAVNSDDAPNTCRTNCKLPWCGDSVIDDAVPDEEACDDGPLNNDRAPNACRENCALPTCGDGVVDNLAPNLEECEPESDSPDDPCNSVCAFKDRTMACGPDVDVVVLGDDQRVEDGVEYYRVAFDLSGPTSFVSPGIECGEDLGDTGTERVFLYTPPAVGTFLARTSFPGTEADTVVYARSPQCLFGAAICNNDAGDRSIGSEIRLEAGPDVATYLIVDTVSGAFGNVVLEVAEYTEVAKGDLCDPPFEICPEGLECLPDVDGDRCSEAFAPVGTEMVAVAVEDADGYGLVVRIEGVDENEDVTTFEATFLNVDLSQNIDFTFSLGTVAYFDDGQFESNTILGWGATNPIDDGFTGVTGYLVDDTGLRSEELIGLLLERTVALVGEDCDGFQIICEGGTSCLPEEGGDGTTCQTADGKPVLTLFETSWEAPGGLGFYAEGTDPEGDIAVLNVTYIDQVGDLGVPVDGADPIDLDLATVITELDGDSGLYNWQAWGALYYSYPAGAAMLFPAARAVAIDESGNQSDNHIDTEVAWPTVSGFGQPCDAGQEDYLCTFGYICDNYIGELGTCRQLDFQIHSCRVEIDAAGTQSLVYEFEQGVEALSDEAARAQVFAFDIHQRGELREARPYPISPAPFSRMGRLRFTLVGIDTITVEEDTHIFCHLKTANTDGRTTAFVRADLDAALGMGVPCAQGEGPICAEDLACFLAEGVTDMVCQLGSAPVIEDAHVVRDTVVGADLTLDLSDADGDLQNAYRIAWLDATKGHVLVPPFLRSIPLVETVYGETDITDIVIDTTMPDVGVDPALLWGDTEFLRVEVYDISGLTDTLDININIAEGQPCSTAADAVPCQSGLTCVDGGSGFVCTL